MPFRALRLTGTALTAERLRLKLIARRQARRAAWLTLAVVAAIGSYILAHFLAWELLPATWTPAGRFACLFGANLVLLGLGLWFGLNSTPSAQERDLRVWRDATLQEAMHGGMTSPASLMRFGETIFDLYQQFRGFRAARAAATAHPAPPPPTPEPAAPAAATSPVEKVTP
ncbi:hypothetical protein IAI18_04155 [Acetobacteraceae bacterium H6797]|nr:hypothetical protein [Acetobacteraceae bacterium H6797]